MIDSSPTANQIYMNIDTSPCNASTQKLFNYKFIIITNTDIYFAEWHKKEQNHRQDLQSDSIPGGTFSEGWVDSKYNKYMGKG